MFRRRLFSEVIDCVSIGLVTEMPRLVHRTITTVGYGDRFPVTESGRVVGMLTMTLGVRPFGVLTSFLANAFIPSKEGQPEQPISREDSAIELRDFSRLLEEQERFTAAVKAHLAQLEASIKVDGSSR